MGVGLFKCGWELIRWRDQRRLDNRARGYNNFQFSAGKSSKDLAL